MPLRGNPDSTIATRTCPDEVGATAAASVAAPAGSASSAACSASSPGAARKTRRVVVATRQDLALSLSAVALSFAVGSALGGLRRLLRGLDGPDRHPRDRHDHGVPALMLAVFCFNLLGDGLRDLIDPRRCT